MVKLTIGLPTYNCENTIGNKIEELLKQSFKDYVLIISDNNSTDNTGKICESMSKKDNRIVFFQQDKNKGPFWNFNFLLQKAQTNYFVMTTPDDILSKNFLESNINILEKCKELVGSIGECSLFNRIIDSNSHKLEINILKNSRKYQYVHPVKGKLKEKILGFPDSGKIYKI